jgi:glyceraldehyde 3-phosphate dehydrogenase
VIDDGRMIKAVSWYDNEWGYSNRCVELAGKVLAPVTAGA